MDTSRDSLFPDKIEKLKLDIQMHGLPDFAEPTNEQKYKDVEKRVEVFNDMVDAGKIPVEHRKHINLDYMTSFDINILYLYVPSE